MADISVKKVVLSQISEDLHNGLTKWKKDDIGFGSLEKKYNLQPSEMIELLAHPKIKSLETRIPTFVIVDDLEETPAPVLNTTIEVVNNEPVSRTQPTVVVKRDRKIEAFI